MQLPFAISAAIPVSFLTLLLFAVSVHAGDQRRPAHCAGAWYPSDAGELTRLIDGAFDAAPAVELAGKPRALICPHAGYRYSAATAATAYAALRGQSYQRVVLLAFSHRNAGAYHGIDVPADLEAYQTPLGVVAIDQSACERLRRHRLFQPDVAVDRGEHSAELQLPFLQRTIRSFQLVPLLVGQLDDEECSAAAAALLPLVDEQTLLVVSTDFTHYGPRFGYTPFKDEQPKRLRELADQAAQALQKGDYDGFVAHLEQTGDTICGRVGVRLLLRVLSMGGGAVGTRTGFATSGELTGDWSNSVTYQAFVFTDRPGVLGDAERAALLKLARETVAAQLRDEPLPRTAELDLPEKVRCPGACFVTLKNDGRLRGCIGNMLAHGPLCDAVVRNAVSACEDYRFVRDPVTAAELDELHIEISYLTPMEPVKDVEEIVIGRDGLLIEVGSQRGVLLPQVAYERGWTRAEFLGQTCRKAGLGSTAWKQAGAKIYSFEAEVFGESEDR